MSYDNPIMEGTDKALDVLTEEGSLRSSNASPKRNRIELVDEKTSGFSLPGTLNNNDGVTEKQTVDKCNNDTSYAVTDDVHDLNLLDKNRSSEVSDAESGIGTVDLKPGTGLVTLPLINKMGSNTGGCYVEVKSTSPSSDKHHSSSKTALKPRTDSRVSSKQKFPQNAGSSQNEADLKGKPIAQPWAFLSSTPPTHRRRSSSFHRKLTQHSLDVAHALSADRNEHTGVEVRLKHYNSLFIRQNKCVRFLVTTPILKPTYDHETGDVLFWPYIKFYNFVLKVGRIVCDVFQMSCPPCCHCYFPIVKTMNMDFF